MIERTGTGDYELICDHCEEVADEDFSEFQEAVQYKKDNGWRSLKTNMGDWKDLCPDCQSPDIIRATKERM